MEMETQGNSRRPHKTLLCDYCNELYSVSYRRCPFCNGGENRDNGVKDHTTITKIQDLPDKKSASIAVAKKMSADPMPEPISEILVEEVPEEMPAPPVRAAVIEKPKVETKTKQEPPVEDLGFSRPEDLLAKLEAVLSADTSAKDSMLEALLAEARGEKPFSYEEEAPSYPQTFKEEEEDTYAPIPPVMPVAVMTEAPEDMEDEAPEEAEEQDAFPENPVDLSIFDAIAAEGKVTFDENEQEIYPSEVHTKGGKRVQSKKGGFSPLRAIRLLISILLIAAAIFIIVTKVLPLVENKLPFFSSDADSVVLEDTVEEEEDVDVPVDTEEEVEEEVVVEIEEIFRLKDTNVTLTAAKETFTLEVIFQGAGELGNLTWASSDPAVVTVNSSGTVTAVGEGDATISATRSDGAVIECSLHCVWSQTEENLNLSLNRDDFTLKSGESFTMEVIGTDSSVTWSIGDSSIATVSDKGVVKYVASGKTTLTATVAGQTLECIVRCS